MRSNELRRRRLRRFFIVSGSLLLLAFTGLCCWIKANEQELLRQVRQAKASGCPCKKIELNQQPQSKEKNHE